MDLLAKYNGMIQLEEEAKNYNEYLNVDSSHNYFIGLGNYGTKIHGPLTVTGPMNVNCPMYVTTLQSSFIHTQTLDVDNITYNGMKIEHRFRLNEIIGLIDRVERLERDKYDLEQRIRALERNNTGV